MSFLKLANCNLCYAISFLGIAIAPVEAGFCISFFGADLDCLTDDIFCLIDSALIFTMSLLLSLGAHKENKTYILAYVITVVVCEIAYWIIFVYRTVRYTVLIHYEFILPSMLWKFFQLFGLYCAIKCFKEVTKGKFWLQKFNRWFLFIKLLLIMDFQNKRHRFCLSTSFLSVVYFSGQCGYNTGLIAMLDETDSISYMLLCLWLTMEGPIMSISSALMVYGLYYKKAHHILKWCIVSSMCIVVYSTLSIIDLFYKESEWVFVNPIYGARYYWRNVDFIGFVWRGFLLVAIYLNFKLFKSMKLG